MNGSVLDDKSLSSILRFHHIGIGSPSFGQAIEAYQFMGYRLLLSIADEGLMAQIALLRHPAIESPMIEIVSPLGENGPLKTLLERKCLPSPYHTCYEVSDMAVASQWLRKGRFVPLDEPKSAKAFQGALVAFFFNPAVGLIEIVENPPGIF